MKEMSNLQAMEKKRLEYPIVTTTDFVASFPKLVEPDDLSGKYQIDALWGSDVEITKIKAAVKKVAHEFFGPQLPKNFKAPWIHAPREDGEIKYEGSIWICLKSSKKPKIYDREYQLIDASEIYGGCRCRAVVQCAPYKHASGKTGVSLWLLAVQFVADGERLGGTPVNTEDALRSEPLAELEGGAEDL